LLLVLSFLPASLLAPLLGFLLSFGCSPWLLPLVPQGWSRWVQVTYDG
jgi:hypothetical protein